MQCLRTLLCFLALLLLMGCASTQQVVNKEAHPQLDFLQEGVTTKEDVLLRLGIPAAQFEGERILLYRLRERQKEGLVVIPPELGYRDVRLSPMRSSWGTGDYSLVLVFDEKNRLSKQSLIRISG
jgi:hypothetical protein